MNDEIKKALVVVLETSRKYGAESIDCDEIDEIFEATYVVQKFLDNEMES